MRGPGHEPQLALSQLWRTHGSHREINPCSDPTSLPTHGAHGRSMKSLSHFAKFPCFAAPRRLLSCPHATPGFTPLLTTLQHRQPPGCAARSPIHTHSTLSPQPPHSSPTFNPHRPASAANASGFLQTAVSDAPRNKI